MMDLRAEFAGTIHLPDKRFVAPGSPVYLPDGHLIALIAWRAWSGQFSILDPSGSAIASCRPRGVFRRRYTVLAVNGSPVLDVLPGAFGPLGRMEVTLGSGRQITVRRSSMWSSRRFEFYAANNRVAGRIGPTARLFSFHPDSYAFDLMMPVMSALEAIALAQALRVMARAIRIVAAS